MAYRFKHGDRPLDEYTIQRAVGAGGFGEVYYAMSDGGREVALKFLRDNPQVELRGVGHCMNLKSPHLVSIFDVKKNAEGDYFIIMEYCSGPSLRDLLIAEPSGFGPQKAAFFVREIAKGLSYLHERGIVHRDLKPGNIFYDDGYVKIGDYGLSKFISISRHSAQTASVGTVHYMAPEIGSGNYSRGVDIYALGVMLYEMLLGRVPFEGSSMAEVLMKHLTTQPEVENLPDPFGAVIRKALEKDPNDRYQTVDEMIEALLEVAEVKESLAGFSPRSLEGAVRQGPADWAKSPLPSPNPVRPHGPDAATPGTPGWPPFAQPVGAAGPLPGRLAKRMERVSRKMEAKMTRMAGRHGHRRPAPPPPPTPPRAPAGAPPVTPALAKSDRRKRILLSGILSLGLAIGLGVLVGNAVGHEEAGIAASWLVVTMSGGLALSRRAIRWFGAEDGPRWSQRMITGCCAAPLMALGAVPLFESPHHGYDSAGVAIWLGLVVLAVFGRWESQFSSEMSFGKAIGKAFAALILVTIADAVTEPSHMSVWDDGPLAFIGAGVAGCVSLVLQAMSWWAAAPSTAAARPKAGGAWCGPVCGEPAAAGPSPQPDAEATPGAGVQTPIDGPAQAAWTAANRAMEDASGQQVGMADLAAHPRLRWGFTRAFWGVAAFLLMGGTIVTFLITLIVRDIDYHDRTGVLIGCMACTAFMLFALRKTTPVKREGFWRETIRPFLQSLALFGIGATIVGIARESGHMSLCGGHYHSCVGDDGLAGLITGLVMCSVMLVVVTALTGRRRRAPKPFVLGSRGGASEERSVESDAPGRQEDLEREGPEPAPTPTTGPGGWPGGNTLTPGIRPHRGVTVLVLGILGINLFPLAIAAWVMGHYDLMEMAAGRMDISGRGITAAGKVCGVVGTMIACLGALFGLSVAVLAMAGAL